MSKILTNPAFLLAVALLLLVLALILLFRRTGQREQDISNRLESVEKAISNKLEENRAREDEQARRGREELSGNLRGMGDSVTRVMGEMARTQQAQLDAFAGKLSEMSRVDEARMDDMGKRVEARLAAYEDRMDRIGEVLDDKLEKNDQRLERMRDTVEKQMERMREGNELRLEQMQQTVDERLNRTLDKRLGESFRLVSDRLDQVYKGLGEMQSLASGVGDLKKVLTGVRSRGLLGEIQLGGLLSQLMTPDQYEQNVRVLPGGEAADFAICLPDKTETGAPTYLPIDAKFPHEAYYRLLDAQESGDGERIDALTGEFEQKLYVTADRIREQFVHPPVTTDFAVLFLGSEGLYAEALRRPEIAERLQREYHVMLTGPSTLAALLNSLQMGFKTIAIERRSEEVWDLLGAVRGEFVNFADALSRTQKKLRQATETIEDASRKSRAIQRKLKGVEKLGPSKREALLSDDSDEDIYDDEY